MEWRTFTATCAGLGNMTAADKSVACTHQEALMAGTKVEEILEYGEDVFGATADKGVESLCANKPITPVLDR